jgi:hypothetical protein
MPWDPSCPPPTFSTHALSAAGGKSCAHAGRPGQASTRITFYANEGQHKAAQLSRMKERDAYPEALGGELQFVSHLHGPLLNLLGAGTPGWRCHGNSKGVGADDIPTVAPVSGLMHAAAPNGDGTAKGLHGFPRREGVRRVSYVARSEDQVGGQPWMRSLAVLRWRVH